MESTPEPSAGRTTLLVFADDWGRHPSSCQHLIRQLLPRYRVHWVNTIGTRRPTLDAATLRRAWEKVRHWTRDSQSAMARPANLQTLNPRMWPWFTTPRDRKINRALLLRQLVPVVRSSPAPVVAVTTLPIVADLIGHLPVARWVYYCVDDFSQWPGLDQAALGEMEAKLVRRADVLIAVSETLQRRLARWGKSSHLLTHGVDLQHWKRNGQAQEFPELRGLERPLIVFWGMIDRRMDVQFVRRMAGDMTCGTVVLVGPESDPDPALAGAPRVVKLPPLPYEQLPHLAREAAVLVMPYADLPVTRAMQPLKLKEYLATGKPVVVRDLPAARPWADCLDLANTPEAFSHAVRLRCATGTPPHQQVARACIQQEGWPEKAGQFERWIHVNIRSLSNGSRKP